jgi:hypothetical protein
MSKGTVTRLFVGSMVAIVAGVVLGVAAVVAAFANGVFVTSGPDVAGFNSSPFAWFMVMLAVVACLAVVGGAVGGLVAWIGALLNTAQLDDKTWFIILLVLGLLSFGLVAMIAYVIAGPDGTRAPAARPVTAPTVA